MKLIDTERKELSKSMSTLGVVSVKLAVHMAADYCLYWILNLIRYYAKFQSKVKGTKTVILKQLKLFLFILQPLIFQWYS